MNDAMPFSGETNKLVPEFLRRLPIVLDVKANGPNDPLIHNELPWSAPNPTFYLDSYVSLVVDTLMFDPNRSGSVYLNRFSPIDK